MCWILEVILAGIGYAPTTVGSAQRALSSLTEQTFPIAFVDARLPDMDGLRLVEELRSVQPAMRIIMISGYFLEDDACIVKAMQASHIDSFLAKPFRIEAILAAITGGEGGHRRPLVQARPPVSCDKKSPELRRTIMKCLILYTFLYCTQDTTRLASSLLIKQRPEDFRPAPVNAKGQS